MSAVGLTKAMRATLELIANGHYLAAPAGSTERPSDRAIAQVFYDVENEVDLVGIDASAFFKVVVDKARELDAPRPPAKDATTAPGEGSVSEDDVEAVAAILYEHDADESWLQHDGSFREYYLGLARRIIESFANRRKGGSHE